MDNVFESQKTGTRAKRKNRKQSVSIGAKSPPPPHTNSHHSSHTFIPKEAPLCPTHTTPHHSHNMRLLNHTFPHCWSLLDPCDGLHLAANSSVSGYGVCLVTRYPQTRTLNLATTLSSGRGSVVFHSDQECTDFVHQFFPMCGQFLTSCNEVQ